MRVKILSLVLASILLSSVYSINYPQQSFAQTQTVDLTGNWEGRINYTVTLDLGWTACTDYYTGKITTSLNHKNNHLTGTVSLSEVGKSGGSCQPNTNFAEYATGSFNCFTFDSNSGSIPIIMAGEMRLSVLRPDLFSSSA